MSTSLENYMLTLDLSLSIPEHITSTNTLLSQLQFSRRESTMPVVKWTRAMELVLLDSMVESVRHGLHAESGFKKAAWVEALRMIVTDFPLQSELTIKQLKTKLQLYKTKWKEWSIIDNLSGWGWGSVEELPTADNATWDAHLIFGLEISFFM